MDQVLERLKNEFTSEESRYAYADSATNAFLTGQIKALREDRGLTQEELAGLVGTQQSGISRWQNSGYSSCKVETLRRFARAFGVRLRITFEEFGSLPEDVRAFTKRRLAPRKFEDDPALKDEESKSEDVAAARQAANATGTIEGQTQPSFQINCDVGNQAGGCSSKADRTQYGETRFRFRKRKPNELKVPDASKRKRSRADRAEGSFSTKDEIAA